MFTMKITLRTVDNRCSNTFLIRPAAVIRAYTKWVGTVLWDKKKTNDFSRFTRKNRIQVYNRVDTYFRIQNIYETKPL